MTVSRGMPEPKPKRSGWRFLTNWLSTPNATIIAAIIAGIATVAGAVVAGLLSNTQITAKPARPHPIDYLPFILILIGLIAVAVLAVGFVAARAGIRKRERRLGLVERLILPDTLTSDDAFTKDARGAYVAAIGQFAKDVVELSRTVSRREGADVVSARQVRRAAELLSVGSASRRGSYMGSVGGILLGAGLAEIFVVLASPKPTSLEIGLTFAASMIGIVLLAYQWFSG